MAEQRNWRQEIQQSYAEAQSAGATPHEHADVLIDLAAKLEPLRDRAIGHKGPIEDRIIESLQQYNGWHEGRSTNAKNNPVRERNDADEPPVVHITRQITDQITAKIINMLLPSNERGWDIEPTPDPEMQEAMNDSRPMAEAPVLDMNGMEMPPELMTGEQGQPMTAADKAAEKLNEADQRCGRMRTTMDDQLSESKFNKLGREVIRSACKVGTGILHGPIMTGHTRVTRKRLEAVDEQGNPVIEWVKIVEEDTQPEYAAVDPLAFYPEAVESLDTAEWAWLWESMSPTRIERLKRWPGFLPEQVDALLKLKPDHGELKSRLARRRTIEGLNPLEDKHFSMWRYFGPVPNSTLALLGETEAPEGDDEDDLSRTTMAEVWMCQGIVLKVKITPMEETDRLPFYAMCYEESESSIFGYGVPDQMRDSQSVTDAAWRMILHNAAIAAGPIVLRMAGALRPLDGDNNIDGGLKQFEIDTTELDMSSFNMDQVIKVIQIEPRIDQLMNIIDRSVEYAQRETNFPVMAQGEPTEAVNTASGLAMLMNAQTVHQRMVAQRWDDEVMIPALEALYDWNMTYNPDDSIKGDYNVIAHGATRLVNKEMQAQHLQVIAALSDNPRFTGFSKDYELYKAIVKVADVDVEQVVISQEEFDQMSEAGPSPFEQAELEEKAAKARKANAEAQKIESEVMQQGQPQGMTPEQMIAMRKLEIEEAGNARKLQMAVLELESAELRALAANEIELAQIEERREARMQDAQLQAAMKVRELQGKEMLGGMKARVDLQREESRKQNLEKGFDSIG